MPAIKSQTIKGYDLLEHIGEGAHGAVYRAHQQIINSREVKLRINHNGEM